MVVIGGMGSVVGAFIAAVLISELLAFGLVIFPQITLVLIFLVMAVTLILKPIGLFGKPEFLTAEDVRSPDPPLQPSGAMARIGWLVLLAVGLVAAHRGAAERAARDAANKESDDEKWAKAKASTSGGGDKEGSTTVSSMVSCSSAVTMVSASSL